MTVYGHGINDLDEPAVYTLVVRDAIVRFIRHGRPCFNGHTPKKRKSPIQHTRA
jgi:hypothetical protein